MEAANNLSSPLSVPVAGYEHPFTDNFTLLDVPEIPAERTKLLETDSEIWAYVPEWQNLMTLHEKQLAKIAEKHRGDWQDPLFKPLQGKYRQLSPIVIQNKASGKWRMLAISRHAVAIYPVQVDPKNRNLIWLGCNDGSPGMHADYVARRPGQEFDSPLLYSQRGGLGLIDVAARTVKYFGRFAHLVSSRVYSFEFDDDCVWIWGKYPAGGELDGISRYDRATGQCQPIIFPQRRWLESWSCVAMVTANHHMEVRVHNYDSYSCLYLLDKRTLQWQLPEYKWVGVPNTQMRQSPDENSQKLAQLGISLHYQPQLGQDGKKTYGNPLIFLSAEKGWSKVRTVDGIEGWVKSEELLSTVAFVKLSLDAYISSPDTGNNGPRFYLNRFHFYCSDNDLDKATQLIINALVSAPQEAKNTLTYIVDRHKSHSQDNANSATYFHEKQKELLDLSTSQPITAP